MENWRQSQKGKGVGSSHLPHVQDIVLPAGHPVGVEHQVAVPSVELSVAAGLHLGQLHIFNTPDLHRVCCCLSAHELYTRG